MTYKEYLEMLAQQGKLERHDYMKNWRNVKGGVAGWDGHIQTLEGEGDEEN